MHRSTYSYEYRNTEMVSSIKGIWCERGESRLSNNNISCNSTNVVLLLAVCILRVRMKRENQRGKYYESQNEFPRATVCVSQPYSAI
jgi:hypothetical protein